jgi:flagellar hook-length control protein FliK
VFEKNTEVERKNYLKDIKIPEIETTLTNKVNFQEDGFSKNSFNLNTSTNGMNLFDRKGKDINSDEFDVNTVLSLKNEGFINKLKEMGSVENKEGNILYNKDVIENNIERIVQEARMVLRKGKSEIKLELEPKSLGKIEMKITMEHSDIVAKIKVDSQEVKNLFLDNISKLKDSLNESGVQIQKIDIYVRDGQNSFSRFNYAENRNNFNENHRESKRYNALNEKEVNPISVIRSMGYNTIELIA